jgi:hypothetical protein
MHLWQGIKLVIRCAVQTSILKNRSDQWPVHKGNKVCASPLWIRSFLDGTSPESNCLPTYHPSQGIQWQPTQNTSHSIAGTFWVHDQQHTYIIATHVLWWRERNLWEYAYYIGPKGIEVIRTKLRIGWDSHSRVWTNACDAHAHPHRSCSDVDWGHSS